MLRATYFDGGSPELNFSDRVEYDVIIVGFGPFQIGSRWPVQTEAIYYRIDGGSRNLRSAPIHYFINCELL